MVTCGLTGSLLAMSMSARYVPGVRPVASNRTLTSADVEAGTDPENGLTSRKEVEHVATPTGLTRPLATTVWAPVAISTSLIVPPETSATRSRPGWRPGASPTGPRPRNPPPPGAARGGDRAPPRRDRAAGGPRPGRRRRKGRRPGGDGRRTRGACPPRRRRPPPPVGRDPPPGGSRTPRPDR